MILDFANKRVLIWGMGREGQSTLSFLESLPGEFQPLDIITTNNNDEVLDLFESDAIDIIMKSPGISLYQLGDQYSKLATSEKLSSQTEVFLNHYGGQTIGITGTKGKSTTASLIAHILRVAGRKVELIGNIGRPAFDVIQDASNDTISVYEMSSHQLEFLHHSPHIAVITNLFEDHLEHYGSVEAYHNAKLNITQFQSENDFAVSESTLASNAQKSNFESNLIGAHNQQNIGLAYEVCVVILGVSEEAFRNALKSFNPLPNRLAFVKKIEGITYYNDSISTIPEATISAVLAVEDSGMMVGSVIIGGMNRGVDMNSLVEFIEKRRDIVWIGLPETGWEISDNVTRVQDLSEAVSLAKQRTPKGTACILSPAAASYNSFKNFEERGDKFVELIKEIDNA